MLRRDLNRRSRATVRKRCHQCSGPFGMVRQQILTFGGWLFFCSKKCKEDYYNRRQQELRKLKRHDSHHS
jgi:hypothetical protein